MIPFNFGLLFRLTYRSLFQSKGTHTRLTRQRVAFLLGFWAVFVPLQFIHWIFFLLDDILLPAYRPVAVRGPVFIVGNPRSGSRHLQQVLARDEETFACADLWEVGLAPSITQRKIGRALARLDRRLGGPLQRWLLAWQEGAFRETRKYHSVGLRWPNEDELSLLPIFSGMHLVFPFPFREEFLRYARYDTDVPAAERERLMVFYKQSMQRTLYLCGPGKHVLSKSPANSGRIGTLCAAFPDAKFIYTTRDLVDLVPSTMSLFAFQCGLFCDLLEPYPFREPLLEMTKHWYHYPLQRLEERPEGSYAVVEYDDLVADLEQTVADIYAALGFEISPAYAQALQEEVEKARRYTSQHRYSLEAMGLTRQQIVAEYEEVYER